MGLLPIGYLYYGSNDIIDMIDIGSYVPIIQAHYSPMLFLIDCLIAGSLKLAKMLPNNFRPFSAS